MRRAVLGLVLLAAIAAAVTSAATEYRAPRPLFADEFNGTQLNTKKWRRCHWWATDGCTIATNHELEWYRPGQVRVGGGTLGLVAERRQTTGADGKRYPFVSGMVSSGPTNENGPRFGFTYGHAAIRARLPRDDGLWPAFWLLPADRRSEPEIDVVEMQSDEPTTATMHLHYRRDGEEHSLAGRYGNVDPGWHTFAIDWRPGRLTWLIDGTVRFRVRGDMVPSEPMYLIANLAVSRRPAPTDATPSPAAMAVDWIRVTR
jgi:beta-glucanase (GH16 family)